MKATVETNGKGGIRFRLSEPLKLGQHYIWIGQRVKLVGPGMAGMPEVESADGSTWYAYPHDLVECN